jgi:cation transport ATPase
MGILGDILGTGKVIEKGFELIDDIHTSKEEELAARAKAKTDLLTAYHPFKRAQRLLAALFCVTYLLCFAMVMGMTLFGGADISAVRDVIEEYWIAEIMFTIIAFYFGGGFAEGAIGQWKNGKA